MLAIFRRNSIIEAACSTVTLTPLALSISTTLSGFNFSIWFLLLCLIEDTASGTICNANVKNNVLIT